MRRPTVRKLRTRTTKRFNSQREKNKINLLFEQNSCLSLPRNATTMDKFFSLFPIQEKTKKFLERSNFIDERINASREKFVWFHVKTRKNNKIERILQRLGSIRSSHAASVGDFNNQGLTYVWFSVVFGLFGLFYFLYASVHLMLRGCQPYPSQALLITIF